MRAFRDIPIKNKLIGISLVSGSAALLLACLGFVAYEFSAYREAALNKLNSVAGVVAANSSAALYFDDPSSATTTLGALRAEQSTVSACIYDADGALFAEFYRDQKQQRCSAERGSVTARTDSALTVSLPIDEDGELIGTLVVRSERVDLYARVARYAVITLLVMLTLGMISLPLASRLQRVISDPLLRLVETAKRVSASKDFSERAVSQSEDEIGTLVSAFNEMLGQIEERDEALARHRVNLEGEVEQRTTQLQTVNQELSREVTQRREAEDRIRYLAYYDGLTGLPNRQLFRDRLQRALNSAKRRSRFVALLFVDLDRFKQVNDTLGHGAGDEMLCEVSERMLRSVRFDDCVVRQGGDESQSEVARLGGDEFTVVITDLSDAQQAATVARRVLEELAEPIPVGGHELYTTASIGIAIYPHDGEDAETLLQHADTAMYHAKGQNRNNFQFYTEAMNASAARRLYIAGRLRHALGHDQLSLHYQPLRNARTGRVTAAEALLRWNDPETGRIGPEEFIPIAEDSGLIVSLGEWVLKTACQQSRAWQAEGYEPIRMAVNISTHQLRQSSWPELVKQTLLDTELSPALLELEVTESAILEHDDATVRSLEALSEQGIGLALDDFGTGYSSLSYLRRFPIERVKIDRSFVSDITDDPEDAALTTAILSMASSLGLHVVAEGVETQEQSDFLRERGCDELQGYLLSPAVPPEEFTRFLTRLKDE